MAEFKKIACVPTGLVVATVLLAACASDPAQADGFWDTMVLDPGGKLGSWNSLAIFPSCHPTWADQPAISYHEYISHDLTFAWFDGSEWQVTVVDRDGDVGKYSSLAIFPCDHPDPELQGRPAIVYFDDTNNRLKYARYDGTTWHAEPGPDVGAIQQPGCCLAILPTGQPAISYGSGLTGADQLTYAQRDATGQWLSVVVDDSGNVGGHTSLAIFPVDHPDPSLAGRPAISYYDWANRDLKFAWCAGDPLNYEDWHTCPVDQDGAVGLYTSLEIFPSDHPDPAWAGQPAISYFDDTNNDLKYAWHEGKYEFATGWQNTPVDGEGGVNAGYWSSLAVLPTDRGPMPSFDGRGGDLAGMPVISYVNGNDLAFAWFDGSEWRSIIIDAYGYIGYYSSLEILPPGEPAIAYQYFYGDPTELRYTCFEGFGWDIEAVDRGWRVGRWTSLAIVPADCPDPDRAGRPAVSYRQCDRDNDLRYAELVGDDPADPAHWQMETAYDVGNVGQYTSLAFYPAEHPEFPGQPAVSHYNPAARDVAAGPRTGRIMWDRFPTGQAAACIPDAPIRGPHLNGASRDVPYTAFVASGLRAGRRVRGSGFRIWCVPLLSSSALSGTVTSRKHCSRPVTPG